MGSRLSWKWLHSIYPLEIASAVVGVHQDAMLLPTGCIMAAQPKIPSLRPRFRTAAGFALATAIGSLKKLATVYMDQMEMGLVVGTTTGADPEINDFSGEILKFGANFANPGIFPYTVHNAGAGVAAIEHRIFGPNLTLSRGNASSLWAIATAADLIANNTCDAAIAGGVHTRPTPQGPVTLACTALLSRFTPEIDDARSAITLHSFSSSSDRTDSEQIKSNVRSEWDCLVSLAWLLDPHADEPRRLATLDSSVWTTLETAKVSL